MVRKIISSGQTGVELAALDTAIKLGIDHGGWTSRGKRNEEGKLQGLYNLTETRSLGLQEALDKNVAESDGTLVISRGASTITIKQAVQSALKQERQFLHVDLSQYALFEAASLSSAWLFQAPIKTVFVTGPLSSEDKLIYQHTQKLLETAFYLGFVKSGLQPQLIGRGGEEFTRPNWPQTVDQAVAHLKSVLSLKDRSLMGNLQPDELSHLRSGIGDYVKQKYGLYEGNEALMKSCAEVGRLNQPLPDEACAVILRALWEDLRRTHKLRVVK
ncbi:MAG: hypothetical protein M0036_14315 [Desulfobacteraceae bacterium]|nr:hypothetical protein [Desulfobacteraceae bacterium]